MKLRLIVDISTRSFLNDAELQIQIKSLVHRILASFEVEQRALKVCICQGTTNSLRPQQIIHL